MADDFGDVIAEPKEEKDKGRLYEFLLGRVRAIADKSEAKQGKLFALCSLLHDFVPAFDWVGFYMVDETKASELVLGPYVGKPTEHERIPFGRGVCGQVAETEQPLIVQDVSREDNYLSCSPDVKSEIVIPITKDGKFIGELDIDSKMPAPFDDRDRAFLEKVCEIVAEIM